MNMETRMLWFLQKTSRTVKTAQTNTINVYDILKYNTVVVTKAVVATIEEVYA